MDSGLAEQVPRNKQNDPERKTAEKLPLVAVNVLLQITILGQARLSFYVTN